MRRFAIICSILLLFVGLAAGRQCYECSCDYDWSTNTGSCTSTAFLNSCKLVDVADRYCMIVSSYNGNMERRVFEAIRANNFQDSHFIQAIEQTSYWGPDWLPTSISSISYGCDWDGCNLLSLAQHLPESFQMQIDPTILNRELIGSDIAALSCEECASCINDLTVIKCKLEPCSNGMCMIDELHNYITTAENNCTYNFFSTCQPATTPPAMPSVRIRATYYIDLPANKQFAIDEVDVHCTKDNCNSIVVVENLKGQVQKTITLHPDFLPARPNATTSMSTVASSTVSTTESSVLTTTGSKSIRFTPLIALYVIITLLLLS